MSRAYVRPITKKQARSYERLIPNGIGVTTIAAVNGRGAAARDAYAKRYEATRKVLINARRARRNEAEAEAPEKSAVPSPAAKPNRSKVRRVRRNEGAPAAPAKSAATAASATAAAPAAKPNRRKTMAKRLKGAAFKRSAQYKKMMAGLKRAGYCENLKGSAKKSAAAKAKSVAPKARKVVIERKTPVASVLDIAAKPKRRRRHKPLPKGPTWKSLTVKTSRGAKKKVGLLKAKVGNKILKTYLIKTKKGKVRHVPDHMLVGFASKRARDTFLKKASPKRVAAMSKREARILPRRVARAERLLKRAQADRPVDIFTPNAVSYSEWSETMHENKKRQSKKAKKSAGRKHRQTAAQKRASLRNLAKARSARRSKAKRVAHKGAKRAVKVAKRVRRHAAKRHHKNAVVKVHENRGRRHKRHHAIHLQENRRHRKVHENRRRHHRNAAPGSIADLIMTGLAVGAGFATHRAIRHVLDEQAFSKIDALKSQKGATTMVASAVTALVGVGALQLVKKQAGQAQKAITEAQGGMIASVVLDLITSALSMGDTPSPAIAYLSGFGEYVPVSQGPIMQAQSGVGSYYPISGLGYTQAIAADPTMQAAAGMGRLAQAAAGMGLLAQAQAGVGEYFAQNIAPAGMGEYFSPGKPSGLTKALPISGMGDMSLPPRLSAAEYALSTAEAVAGLGDDAGEVSIVDAWQVDVPVTDPDEASSKEYGSLSPFVSETLIDYSDTSDEASALRTGVLAGGSFG